MTSKEILRKVLTMSGMTQSQLATKAGFTDACGQKKIASLLCRHKTMKVSSLARCMDALDCDIVIRERYGKQRNEWIITREEWEECGTDMQE